MRAGFDALVADSAARLARCPQAQNEWTSDLHLITSFRARANRR